MSEMSPFHRELFSFLQASGATHAEEEGFDRFQQSIEEEAPLDQIVQHYQELWTEKNAIHVERQWMNSFSGKEFAELGLLKYFPKMYRGLPRLYHREDPSSSRIKKNFSHLPTLKALSVDRALFSLYEKVPLKRKMRVAILTWVMTDGLGDWVAAKEAAVILHENLPNLEIHLVAITARPIPLDTALPTHVIACDKEPKAAAFSFEKKKLLREMDLILQIPTFFPETHRLVSDLSKIATLRSFPKIEHIGEYGFLESSWFHPKTGNRSMGLHALEKGILIRAPKRGNFSGLENKTLLHWLFETETPTSAKIDAYRVKHRFHLAYLSTVTGGQIYFNALLKMWEREEKGIDLCSPDVGWIVGWLEERQKMQLPLLEESYGVREIVFYFQEYRHVIPIGKKGKTVRILSPGRIASSDFQELMAFSEDWVAVRGDQSFSEAISWEKPFFYDGRGHALYFIKDLLALAENRLSGYRSTLQLFRMMGQAFLWNLPEEEGEWVDESYFQSQEKMPPVSIATALGIQLQKPETVLGVKTFCRRIREEYSFGPFLCHLVQRSLYHRIRPEVGEEEHRLLALYATGQLSVTEMIKNITYI